MRYAVLVAMHGSRYGKTLGQQVPGHAVTHQAGCTDESDMFHDKSLLVTGCK